MSVMTVIEEIVDELIQLGPNVVSLVLEIVRGARQSNDPEAYLRRKLEAEAAHLAAQETAREALKAAK